jgi:outer membrane lipoprotein-sorting protein
MGLRISVAIFLVLTGMSAVADDPTRDAKDIVRDAINHWRGTSSQGAMTMTIHRPDWERSMSMESWTQGDKRSLVRVTAPRKDRGNGTLMDGNNMWSFSPKINRVIKVPSSMMSQSWMGSDFSNKDISRADDIVDQYDHTLLGETPAEDFVTYEIEAIPHEDAAVVWGREVLVVRSDNVLVEHRFYDQDGDLVKALRTLAIGVMGGRTVATQQRMEKADNPQEWTEIVIDSVEFDLELSDNLFTLSNLRNPRD